MANMSPLVMLGDEFVFGVSGQYGISCEFVIRIKDMGM
jgi:hypothetical protein